jgi:hypothetical protein
MGISELLASWEVTLAALPRGISMVDLWPTVHGRETARVLVGLASRKVWVLMPELWELWWGWQLNLSRSIHGARDVAWCGTLALSNILSGMRIKSCVDECHLLQGERDSIWGGEKVSRVLC